MPAQTVSSQNSRGSFLREKLLEGVSIFIHIHFHPKPENLPHEWNHQSGSSAHTSRIVVSRARARHRVTRRLPRMTRDARAVSRARKSRASISALHALTAALATTRAVRAHKRNGCDLESCASGTCVDAATTSEEGIARARVQVGARTPPSVSCGDGLVAPKNVYVFYCSNVDREEDLNVAAEDDVGHGRTREDSSARAKSASLEINSNIAECHGLDDFHKDPFKATGFHYYPWYERDARTRVRACCPIERPNFFFAVQNSDFQGFVDGRCTAASIGDSYPHAFDGSVDDAVPSVAPLEQSVL